MLALLVFEKSLYTRVWCLFQITSSNLLPCNNCMIELWARFTSKVGRYCALISIHCYTQYNIVIHKTTWHYGISIHPLIYIIYIYICIIYIVSKCRLLQITLHSCNVYYSAHRSYNRTVLISKYQASQIIHSTV